MAKNTKDRLVYVILELCDLFAQFNFLIYERNQSFILVNILKMMKENEIANGCIDIPDKRDYTYSELNFGETVEKKELPNFTIYNQ